MLRQLRARLHRRGWQVVLSHRRDRTRARRRSSHLCGSLRQGEDRRCIAFGTPSLSADERDRPLPRTLRTRQGRRRMTDATRIPATIITGFLGAGKTTLLRHLLETARGKRLAIVVNEFGSVGVDGETLKSCGIESCSEENIVELSNGCLCCTVAEDFIPTMQALIDRAAPPEHILIETSGLALPKPLIKAFDWPSIRSRLTVDGVIAVVDAPAVAEGRFADAPEAVARQRDADPSVEHDNPLSEVYE